MPIEIVRQMLDELGPDALVHPFAAAGRSVWTNLGISAAVLGGIALAIALGVWLHRRSERARALAKPSRWRL